MSTALGFTSRPPPAPAAQLARRKGVASPDGLDDLLTTGCRVNSLRHLGHRAVVVQLAAWDDDAPTESVALEHAATHPVLGCLTTGADERRGLGVGVVWPHLLWFGLRRLRRLRELLDDCRIFARALLFEPPPHVLRLLDKVRDVYCHFAPPCDIGNYDNVCGFGDLCMVEHFFVACTTMVKRMPTRAKLKTRRPATAGRRARRTRCPCLTPPTPPA